MHLSFLMSHSLLFFNLCRTSKTTTFLVFLSFFLIELSKSRSLKLNISRTAWPILMILVFFGRILNSFSDEINLFWCYISPLTFQTLLKINVLYAKLVLFVSHGTAVQFPPLSLEIEFNIVCCIDYTIPKLF